MIIPTATMRRIIKKETGLRAGNETSQELAYQVEQIIIDIAKTAGKLATHSGRQTISPDDIILAVELLPPTQLFTIFFHHQTITFIYFFYLFPCNNKGGNKLPNTPTHTILKCPECKKPLQIIIDEKRAETICKNCGLVLRGTPQPNITYPQIIREDRTWE